MNAPAAGAALLVLPYTPPLAWPALRDFLVSRGASGVECADGERYVRTVRCGGRLGWIAAAPAADRDALRVEVSPELLAVQDALVPRLRRLFDLDAQPDAIEHTLSPDSRLSSVMAAHPGLRVPGAIDGFELALRAVLGQQVTVKAATTLFGRFATAFGEPAQTPYAGLMYFAPEAVRVAEASVQQLIDLGLTQRRAQTISDMARAIADGALDLDGRAKHEATLERFLSIPGIGPWTASYVAMRALRDSDAFPHSDLGLMKALGCSKPRDVLAAAEAWRPWRAYAALLCWKALAAGG